MVVPPLFYSVIANELDFSSLSWSVVGCNLEYKRSFLLDRMHSVERRGFAVLCLVFITMCPDGSPDIYIYNIFIHSLVFSLEGCTWQEPEPSHVTGMALAHCILGNFLGVVCHCFPPPLDVPTLAARCLRPQRRKDPSSERWNCGRERCPVVIFA